MQTWLVHMRSPSRLVQELGPASFVVSQILFAGMVMSALMHPLLIGTVVYVGCEIASNRPATAWMGPLAALDIFNVGCGYLAFLALGRAATGRRRGGGFWRIVLFTPVYWLIMSLAAWRALLQLLRDPHRWEKTPHPSGLAPLPV